MNFVNTKKPFTYGELKACVKELVSAYDFLDLFSLGHSVLKKELFCIKWGIGETKIFLNGAHHGTEWITAMLLVYFIGEISDAYAFKNELDGIDISALYKNVSFYICPMVNPDGVNLSICGLTDDIPPILKEKLVLYNSGSNDFIGKWQANINGVDLNHNYNADFYKGKLAEKELGINGPSPTRFSGESPESEPETLAIAKFTEMLMPSLAIAYHTQGRQVFYDFNGKADFKAKQIAKKVALLLNYSLDEPSGMASFSGYKDWVLEKLGIPAVTIEAGLGKNPLPLRDFDNIYAENRKMLVRLFTDCLQNICCNY